MPASSSGQLGFGVEATWEHRIMTRDVDFATRTCRSESTSGMTDLILGIETSGFEGSVALRRAGETVETVLLEKRRHAQTLVAQVQSLLRRHEIRAADITTIAVSHGPGSFTGLRVGVVFAKTFAFTTGCRLVAVDTLQCVAAAAPSEFQHVAVIADAQREQLFLGQFLRAGNGPPQRAGEIEIIDFEAFCELAGRLLAADFAVTGPGTSRIEDVLPEFVEVVTPDLRTPSAAHVAAIGERLALDGEEADPSTLEPFYIRRSSAEDKRDAMAAS